MNARQFRELIVRPALQEAGLWSVEAEEILMFTAAVETELVEAVRQWGTDGGYAVGRGPYSMEPTTYYWLRQMPVGRPHLAGHDVDELVWNLKLATVAARLRYFVVNEPLPSAADVQGMGQYWKKYYNGNAASGLSVDQAIEKYRRLVQNPSRK